MNNKSPSVQIIARSAGAFYLFIILAGIFGQIIVRGSLIVPGNPSTTVANIAASAYLWRLGVFGDILMHLCDIPVMFLLYRLFRPVSEGIAMTALGFNLIQTAVLVVNKITLIIPLVLLEKSPVGAAFNPEQINSQAIFWIDVHNYGFSLGLIFFGTACLLYGSLLFKSTYFPRTIGVLVSLAGLSYIINSFTLILAPELSGSVTPVLVIALVGEMSFTLWLLIKGVKVSEFEKAESARLAGVSHD